MKASPLLTEIHAVITDQLNRHVAMTDSHRAWLAKDISQRVTALVAELERDNTKFREDKARLDWLEGNSADAYEIHGAWHIYPERGLTTPGLRLAIDAARRE